MPAAPEPAAARADGSYAQAEALLIEKADTDAPPAEPESAPPPSPLEKGADVKVVSQPSEMSERTSFQDVVERARVANTASKSRLEVDQGENPSPAGEKDALAASGDMADEEGAGASRVRDFLRAVTARKLTAAADSPTSSSESSSSTRFTG
ncbi:hypothetical protein T492DRAFT_915014 [Pavlovales sp. CCMP2436]|nr:hypothetical protein T492DRAFT_915014 [Pavlovales sp. CCMP2436]